MCSILSSRTAWLTSTLVIILPLLIDCSSFPHNFSSPPTISLYLPHTHVCIGCAPIRPLDNQQPTYHQFVLPLWSFSYSPHSFLSSHLHPPSHTIFPSHPMFHTQVCIGCALIRPLDNQQPTYRLPRHVGICDLCCGCGICCGIEDSRLPIHKLLQSSLLVAGGTTQPCLSSCCGENFPTMCSHARYLHTVL